MRWRLRHAWMLGALAALGAGEASAAISCNISATSATGIYTGAALQRTGTFTVNCTRATGDPTTQVLYIGVNQGEPPAGRALIRQGATDTLAYNIFRNPSPAGGQWTEANGRAPGNTANGGLQWTLNFGTGTSASQSWTYYMRVAAGITRPAGVYDDEAIVATLRSGSSGGTAMSTATFLTNVSILSECRITTAAPTLTLNYTSFATSASTATTNFDVTCTLSTPYTVALDATSGTLLGLNYGLSLNRTSDTGTAFPQTFIVTGTIAAGQSGTCNTNNTVVATPCTASATRTITVTY